MKVPERTVIYPSVTAKLCIGSEAITLDIAKKIMGWQEESENIKFGGDGLPVHFRDLHDKKIHCHNNVNNRPIYSSVFDTLKQEVLNLRWRLNGEPIIIGETGLVLNGQHRLLGLIFACQDWELHPDHFGRKLWPTPPVLESVVVRGVKETDDVVNTMDTCKPRSLADVIYRSEYFASMKSSERRNAARMTDYAVRLLWERTGAMLDAFAPRRTHAESLDFIARHPKLLECVKHIMDENGSDNRISRYLGTGYAAGLLYLQGSAATERGVKDDEGYLATPNESVLDWKHWDTACEFWVELAAGQDKTMAAVREAMGKLLDDGGGSIPERLALLSQAWNAYVEEDKITMEVLALEYEADGDGINHLKTMPTVGGIDLGKAS